MALNKVISDPSHQPRSINPPPVDTSLAELIKGLAVGGKLLYQGAAESELVGEESSQIPGAEGLGEARIVPEPTTDLSKDFNFRQIKRAREQGLLTDTQAEVKARQHIRSISNKYPGLEDELLTRARSYFSNLGEGGGTLDKSTSERATQQVYIDSFIKPGVKAGIIDPLAPLEDSSGQANWQKIIQDRTSRSLTQENIQTQAEIGQATGQEVTNSYIDSAVGDSIGQFLNQAIDLQRSGELINDPQQLKSLILQQKTLHKVQLRSRLSRVKSMTSDQRASALAEIDTAYADLEDIIDNGTFSKMLEQKEDVLKRTATIYGISKFPTLFAAEKVAPGIGTQLLALSERFASINNDAQRRAFIDAQPPMIREFINTTMTDPMIISGMFTDALRSNTLPGNEFFDNLFLQMTKDGMKETSQTSDKIDGDMKDLSIGFYLKNAPRISSFEEVTNPSVAERIKKDPKKISMLGNKFVSFEAPVLSRTNEIYTRLKSQGTEFEVVFNGREFQIISQSRTRSQAPSALGTQGIALADMRLAIDELNTLYKVLDYYGLELKINPREWAMETLESITQPVEEETPASQQ